MLRAYSIALTIALLALPAAGDNILWTDPGPVELLDLAAGAGGPEGAPAAPFTFIKEDLSGTYPKITVRDDRGRKWAVKFGREVRAETFASRIAWAAGYFIEPTYFVKSGVVQGARGLKRAKSRVDSTGRFSDARFQLRDPAYEFLDGNNWSWVNVPFRGSRELNGLKIVMMLTSNWDNKDARDEDEGVNTAVFKHGGDYIYAFTDWGGTMGHWGNYVRRSLWNCEHFSADTPEFVRGKKDGQLEWGYRGRHNEDFFGDIRASDVDWILGYVGKLRDEQLLAALDASGATPAQSACFTRELRRRLEMLRAASTSSADSSVRPAAAR